MRQTALVLKTFPDDTAEISVQRRSACGGNCSGCQGCDLSRNVITAMADNAAGAAALAGIRRFEVEVQSPSAAREPVANYPGVFTIRDEQKEECLLLSALCGGRDLSVCRFTVRAGGTELAGPKYVEELLDCARSFPYPVADTKKGLQIADIKDAITGESDDK